MATALAAAEIVITITTHGQSTAFVVVNESHRDRHGRPALYRPVAAGGGEGVQPASRIVGGSGHFGCVVTLDAAFYARLLPAGVPAMVFIGPVIVGQYLLFRRRYRVERTAGEYEAATRPGAPAPIPVPDRPIADLVTATNLAGSVNGQPGGYLAVHNGITLAAAATPGETVIASRIASPSVVPVLVLANRAGTRQPSSVAS